MRRTLARCWPLSAPDSLRAQFAHVRHNPLPDLSAQQQNDLPHSSRADELAERVFARMEQRQDPTHAIAQLAAECPTSGRLAVVRMAIENDMSAYATIAAREEDLRPEDVALLRLCPPPSGTDKEWVSEWWRMVVRESWLQEPVRAASECETNVAQILSQILVERPASAISMGFYCGPFYVSGPRWHEEGKEHPRVIVVEHRDTRFTDDEMWRWADMRRAQYLQEQGFDVMTGVSEEEWAALPDEDARIAFLKSKLGL